MGILGLLALAVWTAGSVLLAVWPAGGVLILDGTPITVDSVDCYSQSVLVNVTEPSGWHGKIYIWEDTHPAAPNTLADPSVPTYSISWEVFRSASWTNKGAVTYWHGYLDATLTDGHHLIGVLRCRAPPA